MKAAMLTYSFYESDTRVLRYAEALSERGDRVDVISLRRPGQSNYEHGGNVTTFRIQSREPNHGGKLRYFFEVWLFLLHAMVRLTWRHLGERYDVIHVHSVPDFLVFAGLPAKLLGAKVILDIHDLLPELYASKFNCSPQSRLFKLLVATERMSAAAADHVIAANHLWEQKLRLRSAKQTKCSTFVNVPDTVIFAQASERKIRDRFTILYPGTLNRHQNLDLAVRAFKRISDQVPEADFYIYGEGPCYASLVQLMHHCGLEHRVFIRGFLATRDIAEIMQQADLGIVPKSARGFGGEAFSTKIMEFMAVGVPVLVSDTPVDRYYFNDQVVSFFPSDDEEALARSMLFLIKSPDVRRSLRANASRFIQNNNWNSMKAEYLRLVDSLHSPTGSTTLCPTL